MRGEVLAWARGAPVTVGDIEGFLRTHEVPPALGTEPDLVRRWALATVLTDAVVAANAKERGCTSTAALVSVVCDADLRAVPPSRRDLETYYRANRHLFFRPESRSVSHARARNHAAAVALAALLEGSPADHGTVVGRLGWVRRGELAGPLENAIFAAPVGQWSLPVVALGEWHLVRVDDIEPAHAPAFEEVEAAVAATVTQARRSQAWAQWVSDRLAGDITLAPGVETPFGPGAFGFAHRH